MSSALICNVTQLNNSSGEVKTINLSESTIKDWSTMCSKLEVSDDDLAMLLIHNYNNATQNDVNNNNPEKISSLRSEHNVLLLSKLNEQHLAGSYHCDLTLYVGDAIPSKVLRAHSSVLVAVLGSSFENLLKQRQVVEAYDPALEMSSTGMIEADGVKQTRVSLQVPNGFENIVQFCYTGSFLPFLSNQDNLQDTIAAINTMVNDANVKEKMLQELNELRSMDQPTKSVDKSHNNEITEFSCPTGTIVDVDHTLSEQGPSDSQFVEKVTLDLSDIISESNNRQAKPLDPDYLWFNDAGSSVEEDIEEEENPASESDYDLSLDEDDIDIEITTTKSRTRSTSKTSQSEWDCEHCKEIFTNRAQLMKHVRNEHYDLLSIKRKRGRPCGSKNKIKLDDDEDDVIDINFNKAGFTKKIRKLHPRNKFNRTYRDPIGECCDEKFFNKFKFGVHVFKEHSVIIADCTECKDIVTFDNLVGHYKSVHGFDSFPHSGVKNETEPEFILPPSDPENDGENSSNLQTLAVIEKLEEQEMWKRDVLCRGCNMTMTLVKYISHLKEQRDAAMSSLHSQSVSLHKIHRCLLFQCQLCQQYNANPEKPIRLYLLLKKHIDRYHLIGSTGDIKETCGICGRVVLKYHFAKHMNYHTSGPQSNSSKNQKVPCDICGKVITKKRISVHRRTHFERYPCPQCSKVFNRKENLKIHERIHTGEKPFVCDICGKGFRQYVELRLHNRKHEKDGRLMAESQPNYINCPTSLAVLIPQHQVPNDVNVINRPMYDDPNLNVQYLFNQH